MKKVWRIRFGGYWLGIEIGFYRLMDFSTTYLEISWGRYYGKDS